MAAKPSARPDADAPESPDVAALRKEIRGEPLTDEERLLLRAREHKPAWAGAGISQEQMTALLEARRRAET